MRCCTWCTLAERQDEGYRPELQALRDRHETIATHAASAAAAAAAWLARFDKDRTDLAGILHTTSIMRSAAQNVRDLVAGYGEIWSTSLFAPYLAERRGATGGAGALARCARLRGRGVGSARTGRAVGGLAPEAARACSSDGFAGTLIITGFIASTGQGIQTTLGRNGSDFSASIFGSLLDAAEIHIWTDVDGVLSADPRRVPNAQVIDSLSYNEAMELAYFGAKVIHPQTMAPAVGRAIPIYIRNTFDAAGPGTLICAQPEVAAAGQGHHDDRGHRARQPRGRRHDRRARAPRTACSARCARKASRSS